MYLRKKERKEERKKERKKEVSVVEYRRRCLNLQSGGIWGSYTNGASLYHRERLRGVGRMFGEPGNKDGFPDPYSESNYALRVGLKVRTASVLCLSYYYRLYYT